jgi:hypothetical protein
VADVQVLTVPDALRVPPRVTWRRDHDPLGSRDVPRGHGAAWLNSTQVVGTGLFSSGDVRAEEGRVK